MRIFLKDTHVLDLKISKKGIGMHLGPPWYDYALNCHLVYLAIPGTRRYAKFVCFNYMQPHKVKFKSVQINMKHVSYY